MHRRSSVLRWSGWRTSENRSGWTSWSAERWPWSRSRCGRCSSSVEVDTRRTRSGDPHPASAASWRDQIGLRVGGQDHRWSRRLGEVEVLSQVAEHWRGLAHVWTRVRTTVGPRIEPLAVEEVVLDEPQVGVVAQRLVIEVPVLGVGADHQPRYPDPQAELVDAGRYHVVVEATPVVPGEEDRARAPVRAPHHRV